MRGKTLYNVRFCALFIVLLIVVTTAARAEVYTVRAVSGTGGGTIGWSAGGVTVGDDAAAIGGTASTYFGKKAAVRLMVPLSDTTMPANAIIYSVTVRALAMASADMAGTYDGVRVAIRVNNTDYRDPAIDELSTSYTYYQHTWATNPNTNLAWTWSEINALEAGLITAKTGRSVNNTFNCDHIEVLVTYGIDNSPPVASAVAIEGIPGVGEYLEGVYTYSDDESNEEGVSTYQWFHADSPDDTLMAAIPGATGRGYVPIAAEEGKYIFFEVTPVASSGVASGTPVMSTPVGPLAAATGSAPVASNVSVSGTPTVGQALAGTYTYNDADGDLEGATAFKWLRNGLVITGATASSYTLIAADQNAMIQFQVVPIAQTGAPKTGAAALSAAVGPIAAAAGVAPVASGVSISGLPRVGEVLTGTYTFSDADGDSEGTSTYRWLRDGSTITGATSRTYLLAIDDFGAMITFEVTPVAQTGTPATGTAVVGNAVGPVDQSTGTVLVSTPRLPSTAGRATQMFDLRGRNISAGPGRTTGQANAVIVTRDAYRQSRASLIVR